MSEKWKEKVQVISQECIGPGIYSIWLDTEQIAKAVMPGQFVLVYCRDQSRILGRPISVCETRGEKLRLVYRCIGAGTREFSELSRGDRVEILGPLGNGFPLERARGRHALLVGGGIGLPPMVELSGHLEGKKTIVAGYRDARFLEDELRAMGELYIASEDGSCGTKGTVLDAIRENSLSGDVIYACGPTPMLRALKAWAKQEGIECWLSLEERMACGIGACLGCVCRSVETDSHSGVHNKRVCKDGPVFLSTEVDI